MRGQNSSAAAPVSELIYEYRFPICLHPDKQNMGVENANASANFQKTEPNRKPADRAFAELVYDFGISKDQLSTSC